METNTTITKATTEGLTINYEDAINLVQEYSDLLSSWEDWAGIEFIEYRTFYSLASGVKDAHINKQYMDASLLAQQFILLYSSYFWDAPNLKIQDDNIINHYSANKPYGLNIIAPKDKQDNQELKNQNADDNSDLAFNYDFKHIKFAFDGCGQVFAYMDRNILIELTNVLMWEGSIENAILCNDNHNPSLTDEERLLRSETLREIKIVKDTGYCFILGTFDNLLEVHRSNLELFYEHPITQNEKEKLLKIRTYAMADLKKYGNKVFDKDETLKQIANYLSEEIKVVA